MRALQSHKIVEGIAPNAVLTIPKVGGKDYSVVKIDGPNNTPYWIMQIPQVFVPDHGSVFRREVITLLRAFLVHQGINNDIHIALGQSADDDLCDTVTAEISPHFRPEPWNELAHTNLGKRPVRLTGQLFFDASHKPCRGNKRPSPQRVSVWEIHPVYALDVCQFRTLSRCKWNDNTVWTPLHEWMSSDDDNDR